MKRFWWIMAGLVAAGGAFRLEAALGERPARVVIRGDLLHTGAGEVLRDGVVVIEDGKIVRVGTAGEVGEVEGAEVLRAAVAIPGLIDAHATVGLSGILNQAHDQEQLEGSAPMQPELRAIDAYNGRDPLVAWVRKFGVTTVHTGHAPGALLSGQSMIIKSDRENISDGVLKPLAMICGSLGEGALQRGAGKSPGTRAKAVALLRAELIRAREYETKRAATEAGSEEGEEGEEGEDEGDPGARDLRLEALGAVLRREVPLLLTVQRHQDIAAALRVAEEFGIALVLDGCAEAHLLLEAIRASGFPVVVHPTLQRTHGESENLTVRMAALLAEAGIPFAFQSGYESYVPKTRVVLFEGGLAASYGVPFDAALEAMTLGAARLLGVEERVGSLEVGKDGDVALYDGDPFEYTTHCVGVVIEGRIYPGEQ
ncbi:MAG TPA: amidohydrolase family protein [Verrucomicrobiales bacterium]|nr:amidohydrolase family protein [Verrucomicrobiales bacterium]